MNREEIIIENMPLVPFIVNKYFKNNKQEIERLSKLKTLTEIGNQLFF